MADETTGTGDQIADDAIVRIPRRRLDHYLIAMGAVLGVVVLVAGGLLLWGARFADDYVYDELSSQNITFPDQASLEGQGRDDLVQYADQQVTTGPQAEAYASYINGHLQDIADGKTYADLGADERAAKAAVDEAKESGASDAQIEELQATATQITGQRDTLFKGETLRGLLLTAYAWATIGQIAMIASIVAFVGAVVLIVLVIAGLVHLRSNHS